MLLSVVAGSGVPAGSFVGREAIAAAYSADPPDDTLTIVTVESASQVDTARFVWSHGGTGTMRLTWDGDLVGELEVVFGSEAAGA